MKTDKNLKSTTDAQTDSEGFFKRSVNKILTSGFTASLFAIILGLLIGLIILFVANPAQAFSGFFMILFGAFSEGMKSIGMTFYYATPIICTGLAVGFAFKTGLFNIGATGQFTMGAFAAVIVGTTCSSLGGAQWIVGLLAATAAGAAWALLPGLLKAFLNVHEVISSIMMNYIGMYLVNYSISNIPVLYNQLTNSSAQIADTAVIPKFGLDVVFAGSAVNGGFIIAILAAVLMHVILNKTTFGFELRAVGFNRNASKYAGINERKSIALSMTIAGALAGLGGGLLFLGSLGKHIEVVDTLASEGFDGISVALLGLSNPIGILFAALFIAYIKQGGFYLQLYEFSKEIIDIIIAVIIYFSAFSLFVRGAIKRYMNYKKEKAELAAGTSGPSTDSTKNAVPGSPGGNKVSAPTSGGNDSEGGNA